MWECLASCLFVIDVFCFVLSFVRETEFLMSSTVSIFHTHESTHKKIKRGMSDSLSEKYSKWDHLVVSSDDEDDCHPNIDIKLWKRLQKEKRERERTEQDDRIEALRARIDAVNVFFVCVCSYSNSSH